MINKGGLSWFANHARRAGHPVTAPSAAKVKKPASFGA